VIGVEVGYNLKTTFKRDNLTFNVFLYNAIDEKGTSEKKKAKKRERLARSDGCRLPGKTPPRLLCSCSLSEAYSAFLSKLLLQCSLA